MTSPAATPHAPLVAVFASFSGQGGVERMLLNLCRGISHAGYRVHLVLARDESMHLMDAGPGVKTVRLGTRHTLSSLPALARYLRRERPAVLLAAKDRAIRVAVLARLLSRVRVTLAGRLGTTVSAALEGRGALRRRAWYAGMRLFYRHVDTIVAVSRGVADDVLAITGIPGDRVRVVNNPVVTAALMDSAREPAEHPWLLDGAPPVILGMGRLTRQKGFDTLIRAFARLREARECRLLILGEGRDRESLESLAAGLGVAGDLQMPGFVVSPGRFLSRASLFVLSSRWEGSPNVLTESLALGCPAVATDCPSGPREILEGGRLGALVPVDDAEALARAMGETLDAPLPKAVLREGVEGYGLENSCREYLAAMGLPPRP